MTGHRKKRLRELIDSDTYKGNQAAFATAVGLTEGRVSQLLSPKDSFGELSAKKIEDELRLGARYFEREFTESEFVEVRRVDVQFSNGTGRVVDHEDDQPPLSFRSDFLRKLGIAVGQAVVVDADGHSNEPKIAEGSVVLINRSDKRNLDGGFFAFRFDGDLLIKRLETVVDVGILATAENPNFRPKQRLYKGHELEQLEVIGRAVWTGAML